MKPAPIAPRDVVAARLLQARELRGLSQREVGMRMSLDKYTASARLSRYESGAMSISLESLFELARALEVPPAYLLASTASMADAVLALGEQPPRQQDQLAKALVAFANLTTQARDELLRTIIALHVKE